MGKPEDENGPSGASGEKSETTRQTIEVGDDEVAKVQRDMGLEIDPATGRAYESQGSFSNSAGASGRFLDGVAIPRSSACSNCERMVVESEYGQGFRNCGALRLGTRGDHFLCGACVARALLSLPNVVTAIRAAGSGIATTGGPYDCRGCAADLRRSESFRGCGSIDVGPRGRHNLCATCIIMCLVKLPGIREAVS